MIRCAHCGGKIPASTASVTVNVAPEFEHEGPVGVFHLRAVDDSGKNCFEHALATHKVVSSRRLLSDVETVLGVE